MAHHRRNRRQLLPNVAVELVDEERKTEPLRAALLEQARAASAWLPRSAQSSTRSTLSPATIAARCT